MDNTGQAQLDTPYELTRYFAIAVDPIHVGTGGIRLGRVDMSIVREPGTNLPKIPGTSIAGACRAYAAMKTQGKYPRCAGLGLEPTKLQDYDQHGETQKDDNSGHCGRHDCPICVTFGFVKRSGASFRGLAQFSDARLVLFPVYSFAGPVWVTCSDVLKELGIEVSDPDDSKVLVAKEIRHIGKLNLGWLMFEVEGGNSVLNVSNLEKVPKEIVDHAVLVSNRLFTHIVNDNLEVRTSVAINPQTGAAAEHALFTYEALPRASVLYFEVVFTNPRFFRIPKVDGTQEEGRNPVLVAPLDNESEPLRTIKTTVENGLKLFEYLGIGGMNTRGMGRLRVLNVSRGGGQ